MVFYLGTVLKYKNLSGRTVLKCKKGLAVG